MGDHTGGGAGQADAQIGGEHSAIFHTGYSELLLFPSLIVSTKAHLAGACIVVFLVALLYEGLRLFVAWLQIYSNTQTQRSCSSGQLVALGALQTTTHVIQLFIGYCLMLLFMSLNVWICLSILLGAGAGFLLFQFRPVKSRLFRLLLKRDIRTEVVSDKSEGEGSLGYEQINQYKLGDCTRKDCEGKKGEVNRIQCPE